MGTATVVAEARRALGPVGVFLPFPLADGPSADQQREAARRLEAAGYRAAWTNEAVGGKDALVQLAVLLAATDRLVLGTSIANIWAGRRRPLTARLRCWPRPSPAGSCSGSGSATRTRRPASAGTSAGRWPRCAATWSR